MSWIRINIVKMSIHPKQSTELCSPSQNSNGIVHRIQINNPKLCREQQKTLNCQSNLIKNNAARGITLLFLYYPS